MGAFVESLRPALCHQNRTRQNNSPVPDTVGGRRQQHNVCYCNLLYPGWMDLHHFEAETLNICKYDMGGCFRKYLLTKRDNDCKCPSHEHSTKHYVSLSVSAAMKLSAGACVWTHTYLLSVAIFIFALNSHSRI